MSEVDYIIAGGGLAGSVMALSLIRDHHRVIVIDEPSLSSSSKVAAGLFQPMTFKRTVETWKGLDSIVSSSEFYLWAEKFLNTTFFYPMPMYRLFSSFEEQNNWSLKCDDPYFSKLIAEEKNPQAEACCIPYGYGKVNHAGYLDVQGFLAATRAYLENQYSIWEEKIDYEQIKISDEEIIYQSVRAKKIIFCEGWLIKNNPWFSYVPMKPVKGEVITMMIQNKKLDSIISSGLFCVPRKDGQYRVGSNYNWKDLDESPTEEVKAAFQQEIIRILQTDEVMITSHRAGIRPASHDRRPILGSHPQYNHLIIFNGLGARGVALAPYAAKFLSWYLTRNTPVPDEMDVVRFRKYFHR